MRALVVLLLVFGLNNVKAQIKLTSGQYTTEDGYYTVTINFNQNELTLIEPNRTSVYTRVEGNIFRFIHPANKIDYRIEVMDHSTIQTFKPGVNDSRYTIKLSNAHAMASNSQFKTYFEMAERYKAKMLTDQKDAQLWSFCAAAAMARSSMNQDGFSAYAMKVVAAVKQIVINKAKCPCEDAIPSDLWNSVN